MRLDDREQVVRASADGRLAVSGTDVRTVSLRILPPRRPQPRQPRRRSRSRRSLWPATTCPSPRSGSPRPCGEGPALAVDGTAVPTRLDGPRSALWGEGDLRWAACAPVVLGPGTTHDVVVRGDAALRPASVAPRRAGGGHRAPTPTPLDVTPSRPTHLTGTVGAGPQRLLALAMNHNAGWEATLAGRPLAPIVVDGFRQGFVVPDGAAGALDVRVRPGRPLPRGPRPRSAARVLLVRSHCSSPTGSRSADRAGRDPDAAPRPAVAAAVALAFALVVAGPWAALAAAVALAALAPAARAPSTRSTAVAVVVLVTGAGVLVAADPPREADTRPGWRRR